MPPALWLNSIQMILHAPSSASQSRLAVTAVNSLAGIDKVEIAFTPVKQVATLPAGIAGAEAEDLLNRTWTPVTLAQRGNGVATTTWTFAIPAGLENYQIDLRATDMLGNVAVDANLWRRGNRHPQPTTW